jgi:hypothetical protein
VPESTLSLTVHQLNSAVGDYLGYGRGSVIFSETTWSTLQSSDISENVSSGLRQVFDPPILPGEASAHNWSFLRPYQTLTIRSGERATPLPDGFGGFEGPVLLVTDGGRYWPVPVVNDHILEFRAASLPDTTGAPTMCCERVGVNGSLARSTRSSIAVWPLPDQDYSVRVSYYYHPDALTTANPYPPGGAAHAELFKASCIAAAELFKDDERGVRYAYFIDRLRASVHADRKRKGQKLGYNGDGSDCVLDPHATRQLNRFGSWGNPITVGGSVPD